MHSFVISKNVKWCHLIWPTRYVDVFISMRSASAAAQTPVDCSELHQQPVDALLRPTFVQKPCYKLQSVVDFTFIQIFIKILSSSLNGAGVFA